MQCKRMSSIEMSRKTKKKYDGEMMIEANANAYERRKKMPICVVLEICLLLKVDDIHFT